VCVCVCVCVYSVYPPTHVMKLLVDICLLVKKTNKQKLKQTDMLSTQTKESFSP
jgi:hypothetical protein